MAGNKTFTFNGTEYKMVVGAYPSNKLALCVYLSEVDTDDASVVLSVNLGVYTDYDGQHIVQRGQTFLDTNNVPDALGVLSDTGLCKQVSWFGEPHTKRSGWCEYPLVRFNMDKLAEYCPDGVAEYNEAYGAAFSVAQHVMNLNMFGSDPMWNGDEPKSDGDALNGLVMDNIGDDGEEMLGF